ncbi:MAG: hypothetical protein V2A56_01650 [bacterium]
MAWTDATTIKLHLQALSVDSLEVRFLPFVLSGASAIQLPHGTLSPGSVRVYALHVTDPAGPVPLTLSGESWYATGYDANAPGSIVIAPSDPPLSRFIEGVDYAVLDETAQVKRIASGAIGSGDTVQAYLLPLDLFAEGVDFEVDYAAGTVTRIVTGNLPDPARVLVSYSTNAAGTSDALIGQAISEAEAKIVDRLRDGYSASSTDEGLVIGATELTLSQLCDDLALRTLSSVGDPSADDRARRFMELSIRFRERATTTLSKFLKQPLPAAPSLQSNTPPHNW